MSPSCHAVTHSNTAVCNDDRKVHVIGLSDVGMRNKAAAQALTIRRDRLWRGISVERSTHGTATARIRRPHYRCDGALANASWLAARLTDPTIVGGPTDEG